MAEEKEKQVPEEEVLNPDDFDESEQPKGDDKPEEGEGKEKGTESKEGQAEDEEKQRRAEFAKRRREKEAAEKAKREREEREAQIRKEAAEQEALGLITKNPYTGKPIKDAKDLEVYKIQKAIDDRGGDPITDLADEIAERNRKAEAERKKAAEDAQKAETSLNAEIDELRKAHPDVNTAKLADDPDFMEIASEKQGRWSLLEIYEEYQRRRQGKRKAGDDKVADEIAKKQGQPGSAGNAKQPSGNRVFKSLKEFDEYWKAKYHS